LVRPPRPASVVAAAIAAAGWAAPARGERPSALFAGPELRLRVDDEAVSAEGRPRYELSFPHGITTLVAGRIHLSNRDGFALYFGSAYAFQKDTVAVLYGIGYRFSSVCALRAQGIPAPPPAFCPSVISLFPPARERGRVGRLVPGPFAAPD
jgi:hypothetical protein